MKTLCHQCLGLVSLDQVAHVDIYSDLCWVQCATCAAAFGPSCGMDRKANPHPHGYLACPYRHFVPDTVGVGLVHGLASTNNSV